MQRFDVPRLAENRQPIFIAPIVFLKGDAAELAVIIREVLEPWSKALPDLLKTYTPATLDAPSDNQGVIARAEGEVDVLLLSLGARVRQWAVRMERWHRERWATNLYSATNVDLRLMMEGTAVRETLEAFIARNVALISDVSAEAQRRISDAIYRGYTERLDARTIAREIRKAVSMGKDRAVRIAGDQNSKLSAALDLERKLEAGIQFGQYRHSGKKHPRAWHKARNGKIYSLKTRRQVNPDGSPMRGGDVIMAEDWPGFPPFCGCRMGAYLPAVEADLQTPSVE